MKVLAQEKETLDALAYRVYGFHARLEALLETNPEALSLFLPLGLPVDCPEKQRNPAPRIHLWH